MKSQIDYVHQRLHDNYHIEQAYIKIHSTEIPSDFMRHNYDTHLLIDSNYTISVSKTLRQSLSRPYNKKCNDYNDSSGQPLAVTSHTQCVRNCIKEYSVKHFNCIPLFIDGVSHELDFNFNQSVDNRIFCSVLKKYNKIYSNNETEFNQLLTKWIKDKRKVKENCVQLCPKDCLTIDYSTSIWRLENLLGNQYWFDIKPSLRPFKRTVVWDTSQPMFAYIQQPVITFTDYLVRCGGLIGLWFGASAQDLLLMMNDNNFIMGLSNILKKIDTIVFITCINILIFLKTKLHHYLSKIITMINRFSYLFNNRVSPITIISENI